MKTTLALMFLITAALSANSLDNRHEDFIPHHDGRITYQPDRWAPNEYVKQEPRCDLGWTRNPVRAGDPGAPAATPEPATWGLTLIGIGLVAMGAKRKGSSNGPEKRCEEEGCLVPPIRGGDFCGPHQLLYSDIRVPDEEPFRSQALREQEAELEVLFLKDSPEERLADALIDAHMI